MPTAAVAIPKGSNAELIVKNASSKDLTLDLESISVNGQRYAVTADASQLSSEQRDGIGKNKRTARVSSAAARRWAPSSARLPAEAKALQSARRPGREQARARRS